MGLSEVSLSMSLFGFWDGCFHMHGIMFLLRAVFNILVRNASPRGHLCFRCMMFSLSGHYFYFVLLPLVPELW